MQISVYLGEQDHTREAARHVTTRHWMNAVLRAKLGRRVGQNAIQLVTNHTWKEIKAAARAGYRPTSKPYIPETMPPLELAGVFFRPPAKRLPGSSAVNWRIGLLLLVMPLAGCLHKSCYGVAPGDLVAIRSGKSFQCQQERGEWLLCNQVPLRAKTVRPCK